MKDDSRGVSYVGENMRTQAISMPVRTNQAYLTRKNNCNPNFKSNCNCVVVPVYQQEEDTFGRWAAKSILTGAAFSLVWDLGTNVAAKYSKNIDTISGKKMLSNAALLAGIFLLVGAVFKGVNKIFDFKI